MIGGNALCWRIRTRKFTDTMIHTGMSVITRVSPDRNGFVRPCTIRVHFSTCQDMAQKDRFHRASCKTILILITQSLRDTWLLHTLTANTIQNKFPWIFFRYGHQLYFGISLGVFHTASAIPSSVLDLCAKDSLKITGFQTTISIP